MPRAGASPLPFVAARFCLTPDESQRLEGSDLESIEWDALARLRRARRRQFEVHGPSHRDRVRVEPRARETSRPRCVPERGCRFRESARASLIVGFNRESRAWRSSRTGPVRSTPRCRGRQSSRSFAGCSRARIEHGSSSDRAQWREPHRSRSAVGGMIWGRVRSFVPFRSRRRCWGREARTASASDSRSTLEPGRTVARRSSRDGRAGRGLDLRVRDGHGAVLTRLRGHRAPSPRRTSSPRSLSMGLCPAEQPRRPAFARPVGAGLRWIRS